MLFLNTFQVAFQYEKADWTFLLDQFLKHPLDLNIKDKESGFTPLMYAATFALDTIPTLVAHGVDPNTEDKSGYTALHRLCSKPRPDLVKILLDAGADVNAKAANGHTPLLAAMRPMFTDYTEKTVENVKILIDRGADRSMNDIAQAIPNEEVKKQIIQLITD